MQITTEMLYELIKELKTDMNRQFLEAREEMKEFKADTARQFTEVREEMKTGQTRLERMIEREISEREKVENKLERVYESRDKVTVSFTRAWATASFFMALIASTIVLAVVKAF